MDPLFATVLSILAYLAPISLLVLVTVRFIRKRRRTLRYRERRRAIEKEGRTIGDETGP